MHGFLPEADGVVTVPRLQRAEASLLRLDSNTSNRARASWLKRAYLLRLRTSTGTVEVFAQVVG